MAGGVLDPTRPRLPQQPQQPAPAGGYPSAPGVMGSNTSTQTSQTRGGVTTNTQTAPPPMPSTYRDPNSGNVFQWRPELSASNNGGWSLMSNGPGNPLAYMQQANSMLQGGRTPPRVRGGNTQSRAAEAAEFSRAKDRIGLAQSGLLRAVGSHMDSRGIGGSSLEGDAISSAMEGGAGQLDDVIRQQAITSLGRQYDVEDRDYAGDINQRGQDVQLEAQRKQAIQALMQAAYGGLY